MQWMYNNSKMNAPAANLLTQTDKQKCADTENCDLSLPS